MSMTSAERAYIDGLWRMLGVAPDDEFAYAISKLIESRIIFATVREIKDELDVIRKRYGIVRPSGYGPGHRTAD